MIVSIDNEIRFQSHNISPNTLKRLKELFEFSVWEYTGSQAKLTQAKAMLEKGQSEKEVSNKLKMSLKQVWWLSSQLKKNLEVVLGAGRSKTIQGWKMENLTFSAPRGSLEEIKRAVEETGLSFELDDRTRLLGEIPFHFNGVLREDQQTAANKILASSMGVLEAPTGSGKTVMAIFAVAERKQPTTILVHTDVLMNQWVERLQHFLPNTQIGIFGGGKKTFGQINIAMAQTLARNPGLLTNETGFLIVDECHRVPAELVFWNVVRRFDCKYLLGLSATPYRSDQYTPMIHWCMGPTLHTISPEKLQQDGHILKPKFVVRETDFETDTPGENFTTIVSELPVCRSRNRLILADVLTEYERGEVCLILTDRIAHAQNFAKALEMKGVKSEVLLGKVTSSERTRILKAMDSGKVKVLVATGQLAGEGMDCKKLSCLFLTMPIKFKGKLIQYIGRILRPAEGKETAKVYDYIDVNVPVLSKQGRMRIREYKKM